MRIRSYLSLAVVLAWVWVAGCTGRAPKISNQKSVIKNSLASTRTPFQPQPGIAQTETLEPPAATPTLEDVVVSSGQIALWVDPNLPAAFRQSMKIPSEFATVDQALSANTRLEVGGEQVVSHWVYALVAPFPTQEQGVSSSDLRQAWQGAPAGPFANQPLLVDESTRAVFAALWGAPAEGAVKVLPVEELVGYAWEHRPTWGMVPFEALEPRWKVLEVDGQSPLRKEFDLAVYPLVAPFSLNGEAAKLEAPVSWVSQTNRDPSHLTVLAMTGTTALVRATAYTMERQGVLYPGKDVRAWLRGADLTHISNEVPFAKDCPFPNPVQESMRFCSNPAYIALLEDVGTDIVELTGDHFQDWGAGAMLYTLDLYRERGWLTYGDGANLAKGRQAVTVEHNGNRLAFIGCNAKGGSYAQAGADQPGAVVCDIAWMEQEIRRLRNDGYLPIATFQHFEYYTYQAQPNQVRDFRALAEAGAVIVSGSQAHQPQAMEFLGENFIHYGLGNLFFDQYEVSKACRQAFIDRHVFYNGRYLGVELLPIWFVDYARPRPMTPGERNELLQVVFKASGW